MQIRDAIAHDVPFLEQILLEAYNWSDQRFTLDWIRTDKMARRYLEGFTPGDDLGMVAMLDGTAVGAVWGRTLPTERPGYGFVAPDIPELTLGVLPRARRQGVGSRLTAAVISIAEQRRIPGLSLSVEDGNAARRLYEKAGFTVVGRNGGSDTMLLRIGDN
ncbi:GNAT family N-acetyltransferase [Micromonospora sp. NPDC005710]|uniref:GNAT family N-acetyltransferase n=1 Tax=Micromonospora sp. NPDC005710 TaxID=3157051 RepID=UPI0033D9FBB6